MQGRFVQEVHQTFNNFVTQVVTLHRDSDFIEFTWTVGPLPSSASDLTGQDVVTRYESDLNSDGFYTDGNGWKNMHRVATLQDEKLPIPSNYYPVVSWIYVQDTGRDVTLAVLPDRPQGGSSLRKGHIELMLDRWHTTSDDLGNYESIWEPSEHPHGTVASGTHRVFLGSAHEVQMMLRLQALQLVYRPILAFAPAQWKPQVQKFSGLRAPLPSTIHLLTLEALSRTEVLLRLEHLAIDQNAVHVNVTRLLRGIRLKNVRPVSLAANQFLPGPRRHRWPTYGQPDPMENTKPLRTPVITRHWDTGDTLVSLSPGEITSLVAEVDMREPLH
ncbi:lysosomal alpha-mannosidase-like [Amblyomma americanum]